MKPVTQRRRRTWPARKVTAALRAKGFTHERIALQENCSRSNVSQVVGGLTKSWRIALAIGDVIGRAPHEIWPRIYAAPATSKDGPTTEPKEPDSIAQAS